MSRNKSARHGQPDEAVRLFPHPENEATTASKNLPIFDKATSRPDVQRLTPANILYLQNTVGNKAVQRLLADARPQSQATTTIQRDPESKLGLINWLLGKKSKKASDQEELLKKPSFQDIEQMEVDIKEIGTNNTVADDDIDEVPDITKAPYSQNNSSNSQNSKVSTGQGRSNWQIPSVDDLNAGFEEAREGKAPLSQDYEVALGKVALLLEKMKKYKQGAKEGFSNDEVQNLINLAEQVMGGGYNEPEKAEDEKEDEDNQYSFSKADWGKGVSRRGNYTYGNKEAAEADQEFTLEFIPESAEVEPINGSGIGTSMDAQFNAEREGYSAKMEGSATAFAGMQLQYDAKKSFKNGSHEANLSGGFSNTTGVGAGASLKGSAGLTSANLQASAQAFVGSITKVTFNADYTYKKIGGALGGEAKVDLGAKAAAGLKTSLGKDGFKLKAEAGAFVGAEFSLKGKAKLIANGRNLANVNGAANLLLGAGGKGGVDFSLSIHEIGLSVKAGAAAGVGFSGELGGSVSPSQIAGAGYDAYKYVKDYKSLSKGYKRLEDPRLDPTRKLSVFSVTLDKLEKYRKQLGAAQTAAKKAEFAGKYSLLGKGLRSEQ